MTDSKGAGRHTLPSAVARRTMKQASAWSAATLAIATSLLGCAAQDANEPSWFQRWANGGSVAKLEDSASFDHLRLSVVRIQAVSPSFDWFKPFIPGGDNVGVGTGFIVQTDPYPLFVTNEHVINDARQVNLQLLLYGQRQWEAQVVSVCPKFDLALVVLKEPKQFLEAMKERKIEIKALTVAEAVPRMGDDVVALGFPLGQDSLKISKGNIAGNEDVDGNTCIQSTAPISPGSSGGPLLNSDGSEVVGVNFAKATQGENINYVIPAWRVSQMMKKHLEDQPSQPKDGQWKRVHVKVPKPELTTIESNEALYTMSKGCDKGVYMSKVGQRSFFLKAEPKVEEGSFLTSVNGAELDRFGMGLKPKYAADNVHFQDLFFMVPVFGHDIQFETCFMGKTVKHNISMAWHTEYERGLQWVHEPNQANLSRSYEMFGDISVMQMTVNHVSTLVNSWNQPGPARWLHPDLVSSPRLLINYVRSGSYASHVLAAGSAVAKVNGHEVHTLEEFRNHFHPADGEKVWTLQTDMGRVAAVMFEESLNNQLLQASNENAPYLLTPGVVSAAKALKLSSLSSIAKFSEEPLGSPLHGAPKLVLAAQHEVASEARRHEFLAQDHSNADLLPVRASGPLAVLPAHPDGRRGRMTQRAAEAMISISV